MSWRYDPIFISEKYSADYRIKPFESMAERLRSSTHQCVVSFIDLYKKQSETSLLSAQCLRSISLWPLE